MGNYCKIIIVFKDAKGITQQDESDFIFETKEDAEAAIPFYREEFAQEGKEIIKTEIIEKK